MNNLDLDIFNNRSNIKEEVNINLLKSLKSKIKRKNITISIVSILCTTIIFLGGYFAVFVNQKPIDYRNRLLDVHLAGDKVVDISFKGKDYYK